MKRIALVVALGGLLIVPDCWAVQRVDLIGGSGSPLSGRFQPQGIAVDARGSVYVADVLGDRVLRRTPAGRVSMFAGTGRSGYSGDGGLALRAALRDPSAVLPLPDGRVLISDSGNDRIRVVSPDGRITTVAGGGGQGFSGDGGPATSAALHLGGWPSSMALDPRGGFDFADPGNGRVRWVDGAGVIRTIAGRDPRSNGTSGASDPFQALMLPTALARDERGLFILDANACEVWLLSAADGQLRPALGVGGCPRNVPGMWQDGGLATTVPLVSPRGIGVGQGQIAVSDPDPLPGAVRLVDVAGRAHTAYRRRVGPVALTADGLVLADGAVAVIPAAGNDLIAANIATARVDRTGHVLRITVRSPRRLTLSISTARTRWTRTVTTGTKVLHLRAPRGATLSRRGSIDIRSAAGVVLSRRTLAK